MNLHTKIGKVQAEKKKKDVDTAVGSSSGPRGSEGYWNWGNNDTHDTLAPCWNINHFWEECATERESVFGDIQPWEVIPLGVLEGVLETVIMQVK